MNRHFRALIITAVMSLAFAAVMAPQHAEAKLGNAGNCLNCHNQQNTTAYVHLAVDGTTVPLTPAVAQVYNDEGSISVSTSQIFEVDFFHNGVARAGSSDVAIIFEPGSTWSANGGSTPSVATKGTGLANDLTNWNVVWDGNHAQQPGWNSIDRAAGGTEPVGLGGGLHTINWNGTTWDHGATDTADDGGVVGNGDLDAVASRMGADILLTAPSSPGSYIIYFVGVGEGSAGSRGYVATKLTVTVSSGADVTPPVLVADFAATSGQNAQVPVSWTNPADSDLAEVLLMRKAGSYPTDHLDAGATQIYQNLTPVVSGAEGLTDTIGPPVNGTTYYYVVFVKDSTGNWNDTVTGGSNSNTATPSAGNSNPDTPTNLAQNYLALTPIALGGYTTEASVVFEADIADSTDTGDTVKLQIDTDSNGTFDCESVLGLNPSTNVQVTCGLVDGSYDWQARTVDNLGAVSAWVPFNAASPDFIKDASAPVDGSLTPSAADGQVVLNWTVATDAHSGLTSPAYTVAMASGTTTPPADCSANVIYTGDALTHTETLLTNGIDYAFRVCATNNAGLTSVGATATAQPAAGCTYANPTVTILTASRSITNDGGFADYTVQVTNNDSVICGNTIFTLSAGDTNSTHFYASTLTPTTLTVAPGAAEVTTLRVTAKANQPNASTSATTVSTAADGNHIIVNSAAVTTTINVSGGGCIATGSYLNANGDQMSTSR